VISLIVQCDIIKWSNLIGAAQILAAPNFFYTVSPDLFWGLGAARLWLLTHCREILQPRLFTLTAIADVLAVTSWVIPLDCVGQILVMIYNSPHIPTAFIRTLWVGSWHMALYICCCYFYSPTSYGANTLCNLLVQSDIHSGIYIYCVVQHTPRMPTTTRNTFLSLPSHRVRTPLLSDVHYIEQSH